MLQKIINYFKGKDENADLKYNMRQSLRRHIDNLGLNWRNMELHFIKFTISKDKILMEVTLGRPSLLIGPQGINIDNLTKRMTDEYNIPFKIILNEYSVWSR